MKRLFFFTLSVAVTGGVACSGGGQDPGLVAAGDASTCDARSGVDKVTCYPALDVGINPRKGSVPGNRIQNYKFVGYPNDASATKLDTSKGTSTVQLADYFDPKREKYSIIILNVAARWCGPCVQETNEIVGGISATYGAKKVVFVQAITEGLEYKAATLDDLNAGVAERGGHATTINFTSMLDPNQANLGAFFDRAAIPFNAVLDARSMEILYAGTGAPPDISAFLDKYLALAASITPKP